MPHSRLKLSSSSDTGAPCVLCFSLRPPRKEFDLTLKLPLRSRLDPSSSSGASARDRFGDIVRRRLFGGGMGQFWGPRCCSKDQVCLFVGAGADTMREVLVHFIIAHRSNFLGPSPGS